MERKINILDIFEYYLKKSNDESKEIDHYRLQKIVFCSWSLTSFVYRDDFEDGIYEEQNPFLACLVGPLNKTAYKRYKKYGMKPITTYNAKFTEDYLEKITSKDYVEMINNIWNKLSIYENNELAEISYLIDLWKEHYKKGSSKPILLSNTIEYYKKRNNINNILKDN